MAQKQVGLRLDPDLLERLDQVRGDVPRNRWIVRALEQEVQDAEGAAQLDRESAPPATPGQTTVEQQIAASRTGPGQLGAERLARFAPKS